MRILQVINSLETGGAERLVTDLVLGLKGRGHELWVHTLSGGEPELARQLASEGVGMSRGAGGSVYSPGRIPEICGALRAFRPEIVHVHLAPALYWVVGALWLAGAACSAGTATATGLTGTPGAAAGTGAAGATASGVWGGRLRHSRIPLVTTEHTTTTRRMGKRWLKPVEKLLYTRVDSLVCPGPASVRAVARWLDLPEPSERCGEGEGSRFRIIPNGVNLARFKTARSAPDLVARLQGRRGIVMAARFTKAKDHATAIQAMQFLPEDTVLVLAGDGETRSAMEALAAQTEFSGKDRILFLGTRNDMPEVFKACSAALQSSFWEGFAISVIEALASGLPLAASDLPGIRDAADDSAFYFEPGNPEACACALSAALDSDTGWKMAGSARAEKLDMERCIDAHEDLYRELTG